MSATARIAKRAAANVARLSSRVCCASASRAAAVGGTALAMVLIFVINRAYFGWTIQVHWPWVALAEQGLTILAATVIASLYPAAKASRTAAAELRREDV